MKLGGQGAAVHLCYNFASELHVSALLHRFNLVDLWRQSRQAVGFSMAWLQQSQHNFLPWGPQSAAVRLDALKIE